MDTEFIKSLVDFGALGMFAGFLIWLNTKTQRRLDELSERFISTTQDIEKAHEAAEELIRQRYDSIIARYDNQRDAVYADVVKKLDDHSRLLEDIHVTIRSNQAQALLDPTLTHPDNLRR